MAEPRPAPPSEPAPGSAPPVNPTPAPGSAPPVNPTPAPGWKEVLLVAAGVVATVLAAAVVTSLLPVSVQQIVFKTPLAIVVLLVGTVWLLLRLRGSQPPS